MERGAFMGDVIILPSTFPGGPRYMRERYNESMSLVKHFGVPNLFITFTCNPKWREIREACSYTYVDSSGRSRTVEQKGNDRPDILVRVFKQKVDWFLEKVKAGYFGEAVCWDYVIEFQMRGLPHCHSLITLSDRDKPASAGKADNLVSAEIPDPTAEPALYELVHGPCRAELCLDDDGRCNKKFPKEYNEFTNVDVDSYSKYKRPHNGRTISYEGGYEVDNRYVVPFNKRLLIELDCHANMEICGSIKAIKYLKKYLFKGCERSTVEITDANVANYDEIKSYEDRRALCSCGAAWRLFKYPLQKRSHSVVTLHVHPPGKRVLEQRPVADGAVDGDSVPDEYELPHGHKLYAKSHLVAWFELNQRALDYKRKHGEFPNPNPLTLFYDEIPRHFTWQDRGLWTVRRSYFNTVGRLPIITPTQRETFFLRILLLRVKGATCFRDLKTYDGVEYKTFGEACLARGLTTDDKEWELCLQEAALFQMPQQLRHLFASILVHCDVVEPHVLREQFKLVLSDDLRRSARNEAEGVRLAYADIVQMLQKQGKHLSTDFPTMPPLLGTIPVEEINVVHESLKGAAMLEKANAGQKHVVETVIEKIYGDSGPSRAVGNCLFVGGEGGTGKTYTYETIYHIVRGRGDLCVTMASTGCAATLLPGGRTVHNAWDIPVPTYSDSDSRINAECPPDDLKRAKVFILDEAPMLCKYVLEAMDRRLRVIHGKPNVPFGGVVVLLGGDFAQCLPVNRQMLTAQLIGLSIRRSYLWQYFRNNVFILTENMRARQDPQFVDWLRAVGKGANFVGSIGEEAVDGMLSSGNLIVDVYNKLLRGRMSMAQLMNYLAERCILSPKNDICFKYNDEINFLGFLGIAVTTAVWTKLRKTAVLKC